MEPSSERLKNNIISPKVSDNLHNDRKTDQEDVESGLNSSLPHSKSQKTLSSPVVQQIKTSAFGPCCGIISLQYASLIIGIFGVGAGCTIPMVIFTQGRHGPNNGSKRLYPFTENYYPNNGNSSNASFQDRRDFEHQQVLITAWLAGIGFLYPIVLILKSTMLFFGAENKNKYTCLIWIILSIIELSFWTVVCFLMRDEFKATVVFVLLGIYFIVIVFAFSKELRYETCTMWDFGMNLGDCFPNFWQTSPLVATPSVEDHPDHPVVISEGQ